MAEEVKSESEKKKEDWMNSKWRPMMGWSYMLTCIADFVIFPVLWSVLQALSKGQVNVQWQPITLQGAGLYHIAMGAVLGIAAYGRTQEKLGGANNGGITAPSSVGTTYTPPASVPQSAAPASFSAPVANSFGSQPLGVGSGFGSTPAAGPGSGAGTGAPAADVTTGFGGKPAPVIPPFPER
jgi:cytochrome c biogenesis protein CcdA